LVIVDSLQWHLSAAVKITAGMERQALLSLCRHVG
jgi:hypothetical protein